LHHAFEAHADARPQADALLYGDLRISYGELEARANRLAHHLRARGVGPECRVGICLERGPEVVVAILAVLKAGGGYLPLDPAHPRERLARMLETAGARVLVTESSLAGAVPAEGREVVLADGDAAEIGARPAGRPRGGARAASLAYVIFTSGSTGEPKGIALAHRGVVNNLWDLNRRVGPADRVLLLSSLGFDMSVYETLGILSAGGAVVVPLPEEARDPAAWAALCRRHGVTVWNSAPALLGLLADHVEAHPHDAPRALRVAFLGGDWVPVALPDRVRAWAPGLADFIVMGGATEASIHSVLYAVGAVDPAWASIPYGLPMANQRAHVLDDGLRPLGPGEAGELYLGGVGLARGYTGRAALTAERFLPDPVSGIPGARLYRTGDRARRFADGTLELLGRADHQVKLRGFRVEPAEVEAALARHPSVARAVVVGRRDGGETRLAAYLLAADPQAPPRPAELRDFLRGTLPEYMVPAAYVLLDRLPLSPNGKVDRRALPEPPAAGAAGAGGPPRTAAETAVAAEAGALLGVDGLGVDDDFFALGGHSLSAARLLARLRGRLGAEVTLRDFFAAPTVAALAARVEAAPGGAPPLPPIPPVQGDGPFPLSPAQRRLWFVERMDPGSATYHVPVALRLSGPLDAEVLQRALQALVARHEALRTVFGEAEGEPAQWIAPAAPPVLARGAVEAGEAALRRRLALEAARPFDLVAGPPFRALLLCAGPDDHVLLLVAHHLVSDGWSTGILLRDLAAAYDALAAGRAPDPAPPAARYAGYAAWQCERVAAAQAEQLAWWRAELAGAPALLQLPTDRPRPAVRGTRGAQHPVAVPAPLAERARALGRAHGATLHMVLLAALDLLLARYAGADDVVVGAPAAGRAHPELEGVAGFFVNTLTIRAELSGDPTVAELLARVRDAALGAYEHEDVPFDQVVEAVNPERSLSHTPLVQVSMAFQHAPARGLRLGGAAARTLWVDPGEARFDLTWLLEEDGDGVSGVLEYATELFDAATAERMAAHWVRLLEGMTAAPGARISALSLLTPEERAAEVAAAGPSAPGPEPARPLHALFAARAARTPEAPAVSCEGRTVRYGELDAWSRRLAARLRRAGVAPGDRVGLAAARSADLVAAMLAILRAGAAYVPLDPAYPADRLAFMAADAGVRVVLAHPGVDVPEGARTVLLDDAADEAAEGADPPLDPRAAAYVIYTSGSTGRPKGVEVPHANVVRLFAGAAPWFRFGADDVWTLFHSCAFDFSVWEVWGALLHGGRVAVVPLEVSRSPEEMYALLEREGVTVLSQTPSAFRALLRVDEEAAARGAARALALREVVFGGEALDPAVLAGWMARRGDRRPRLVNMYGITETTVVDTVRPLARGDAAGGASPIGVPMAEGSAHVLDPAGEPQPAGVPGELYVGGGKVARGYLGRPALTAQRFVPDPFSREPGARLYRSGDRVRRLPSGELEYLGRIDQQVKVRGFRIEPGEIEAVLRAHPALRDAVVLARPHGPEGEPRLVAWVVAPAAAPGELPAELREWTRARLPGYMVPSAVVPLAGLPLTRNGKVDARALPDPPESAPGAAEHREPRTPTERALAAAWAEVLGVERVGLDDDFFDRGGHSLQAARLVSRLRAAVGVELPVRALFEARTLEAVAARADALAAPSPAPAAGGAEEDTDAAGTSPATSAQRRLWFLEQLDPGRATYHVPVALRLSGPLDAAALARALTALARRHPALRTTLAAGEGGPVQRVAPASPVPLPVDDAADEDALRRALDAEAHRPFDLARGPLFRARLVRRAADDHVLLLVMHHAVADGWSVEVVLRELSAVYAGAPLAPLSTTFAAHAARAVEEEGAEEGAGLAWWRGHLQGAPPVLEIPGDRPRPPAQSHRGGEVPVRISPAAMEGLRALARAEGVTLHMALLAGWALYLGRAAAADDVVVGEALAGRDGPEVEGVVGMFVRTLPLRVRLDGAPTVRALLGRVREAVLGAREHASIPLERLVEALRPVRDRGHAPLFQAVFVLNPPAAPVPALGPVRAERVRVPLAVSQFDLLLEVQEEEDGGVGGVLQFSADLFDRGTAERMAGQLARLLGAMAAAPDAAVPALEWLDPAERRQVLEGWNPRPAEAPFVPVHALFSAQAARTPDAPAIVHEGRRMTYAELDARANRLAHRLRRLGVGPEVRVGVCLERTPALVEALLAVLKAGGAYLPLDPAHPPARIAEVLRDAGAGLALAGAATAARLPASLPVLRVDDPSLAGEPESDPGHRGAPQGLAYVLYTSGSTGRPKGVMVTHGGVSALVRWMGDAVPAGERAAVLAATPVTFDVSVAELFGTLCWGGTLVMAESALALGDAGYPVRLGVMVPTAAAELLRAGRIPPGLRALNLAGEALPAELARGLYAAGVGTVRNLYGPTEDTVYSTCGTVAPEAERVAIGRPAAGSRAWVLGPDGRPVPPGIPGELFLGGAGVARGYAGRPALTAERFLPDPFAGVPGARMYRTGDAARWDGRGELHFVGRLDAQLKLRGFRVEPGEVEAALLRHPGVREAVVDVRGAPDGGARLAAWFTADEPAPPAAALRDHLRALLPGYMVPAAFARVQALSRTASGKLDRRALPAPPDEAPAVEGAAPRTPAEARLATLFAEALRVERVGIHNSFFDLGGHSLLAWRLASAIPADLGGPLPVSLLFEAPSVAGLAARLAAGEGREAALPPLLRVPQEGPAPLSVGQEALWYLGQVQPGSPAYSMPFAVELRGALDTAALQGALDALAARHEALRTTLAAVDGAPAQRVAPPAPVAVERIVLRDPAERAEVLRAWARRPFDLSAGPLFRAALVDGGDGGQVLLLNLHHAVGDGGSAGILFRELAALYAAGVEGRAADLPEPPLHYGDFAAWQRTLLDGGHLDGQLAWWRGRLAGAPPVLELPTDRPRPARPDDRGLLHVFAVPAELAAGVRALARDAGATPFMVLAAAWNALLARWTGAEDLVVGVPAAGRGAPGTEGIVGFFANTLVLRTDLSGDPAFREVLDRTAHGLRGAYAHADVPFERVVEAMRPARDAGRAPLVQAVVHMHHAPGAELRLAGVEARVEGIDTGRAKLDLALLFEERGGELRGELTCAAALFDPATAARMTDGLLALLRAAVDAPHLPLSALPAMGAEERRRVVRGWNATDFAHPRGRCIHDLFREQAARTPEAEAVAWDGGALTYRDLDARAGRLARVLRGRGVGPDVRVGVCLERGPDAIVALLAVLRAGGCYVPLDPEYPPERLRYMADDARAALVVTREDLRGALPVDDARVLRLDAPAAEGAQDALPGPDGGAVPGSLCYLVYTSGSTGRPKGAMVEHRGVPNLVLAQNRVFGLGPGDRVLQFAPLGFDASVSEIFLALVSGATLCIPPADARLPGLELVRTLEEMRITKVKLTASALAVLPPLPLPALRVLVLGGEACPRALAARWAAPHRRVWSVYGPTEATARVCLAECAADDGGAGWVPLGRVMDNDRVYVLDRWGQPAPAGVAGELMIGGIQVGRGYLDRPALTADRFVPDPFGAPGARLYRTGDRARWTAGGELEFLGRTDLQVKLRGFRVEPGEVEAALRGHPAVRDAVAAVREEGGEPRLVAWIVSRDRGPAPAELREWLRDRLPEHLVPSAFAAVDEVPLTPNGKVDRAALPTPSASPAPAAGRRAPATEGEARMAEVWSEVLGCGPVGMDDDFYLLGGHSLAAVRLAFRVREAFGVQLPLRDLLAAGTVAGAAARVEALRAAGPGADGDDPPLAPAPRGGPLPLSLVQEHLWLAEQRHGADPFAGYPACVRLEGALQPRALRQALDALVRRHDSLRTVFRLHGGAPAQVVLPPGPAPFHLVDLSHLSAAEAERAADRLAAAPRPFDLERGPLFTVTLVRTGARRWRLLYTRHHLAGDGWSSGVLLRELSALYDAFAAGRPSPLGECVLQYGDWAAWQRAVAAGPGGARALAWWRRQLEGARAPDLVRSDGEGGAARPRSHRPLTLSGPVLDALREMESTEGCTLFVLLLAAVKALLARHTGETDLCLFTPVAGRTRPETAGMIGYFSHQVPLRTRASGNPSFRALAGRVRDTVLDALSRQELPCVERPDLAPGEAARLASLCRMAFACAPVEAAPLALGGVRAEWEQGWDGEGEPRGYDSFTFVDRGDRVDGRLDYRLGLYAEGDVEALVRGLELLLHEAAADPDRGIFDLPLGAPEAVPAGTVPDELPDFDL
jgi:amino acid adenylation domain-containing protein